MLQLSGVDLIVDADGELGEFIRRYVPTDLYLPWRRQSWPGLGTAGIAYPTARYDEPKFVLNRLHWPCRDLSRWGFIHVLCHSDGVDQFGDSACSDGSYSPLSFLIGNPETGGDQLTLSMYLLPPTPLSGIRGLTGDLQSLYLLTLVDFRYFLNWVNTGDLASFMTKTTTWDTLYEYLSNQIVTQNIPFTFSYDSIPSAYLQPSIPYWSTPYEPIAQAFDAVAFNVGQRIGVNWDGSCYAYSFDNAYSSWQSDVSGNPDRIVLAGGERFANPL